MKVLVLCILLCVTFVSGFYIDNNGTHEEKIIGGIPVRIEDIPYQAILGQVRENNFCGASIIHESWLITAANCVHNRRYISVRTASGRRIPFRRVRKVEEIIIHPDFQADGNKNDIALIKLAVPIKFNDKQQRIELAKPHNIPREGEMMWISGFGSLGPHQEESNHLMAAYVSVMNQERCKRVYGSEYITDNMFCASNGDVEACYGDSGGPGAIHGKLHGIISGTRNCGLPGVYTSVHKFYDWIVEKTGHIF